MHFGMVESHVPFLGHCDLGLVFRIIMFRAYLLYCFREEFQVWCLDETWDGGVSHSILGSL